MEGCAEIQTVILDFVLWEIWFRSLSYLSFRPGNMGVKWTQRTNISKSQRTFGAGGCLSSPKAQGEPLNTVVERQKQVRVLGFKAWKEETQGVWKAAGKTLRMALCNPSWQTPGHWEKSPGRRWPSDPGQTGLGLDLSQRAVYVAEGNMSHC